VCGIRDKTLIINLPGSRKAAIECLSVIAPVIPHAMDLIQNNKTKIENTHKNVQCNISSCSHISGTKNLVKNIFIYKKYIKLSYYHFNFYLCYRKIFLFFDTE